MHHAHEEERLRALRSLEVLDTAPEPEFEAIVNGARHLFGCKMAFVSLMDANRQWFKSRCNIDAPETPRDISICQHAIVADATLVIPDTLDDPRFVTNPFVVAAPFIRFYAGVPLRVGADRDGARLPVGTLCVADDRPRHPSADKIAMLEGMARVIEAILQARRTSRESLRLALERQEALVEIARTQRLLQQAERMARFGSWRLDLVTKQSHWSAQTFAIHQLPQGGIASLDQALDFYPPADRIKLDAAVSTCAETGESWDLELDFINAKGVLRRIRTMGEAETRDGKTVAIIGVIQDVTERYKFERRLREFALTDDLTGLASRRAFNEGFEEAIAAADPNSALAVAIIDLDRFKEVNDRLGHPAGDEVLRLIAAKLQAAAYLGDYLPARLGGDEFVILLHGSYARERLPEVIEHLLADLRHDVATDGESILVSATIGACVVDAAHTDRSTVLKAADEALYRAKRVRRGTGAIAGRVGLITATDPLAVARTA
jgi:diguanylate cyclase (GGDEF)-like protein